MTFSVTCIIIHSYCLTCGMCWSKGKSFWMIFPGSLLKMPVLYLDHCMLAEWMGVVSSLLIFWRCCNAPSHWYVLCMIYCALWSCNAGNSCALSPTLLIMDPWQIGEEAHSYVYNYIPAQRNWWGYTGITLSVCLSVFPSVCRWHGFRSVTQVCYGILIWNFICMLLVAMGRSLLIFSMSLSKWPYGGHLGFFGFQTLTSVWLWISSPNFSSTLLVYMERSLLIFRYFTFKMAAQWPYWIFWVPDSNFSLSLNFKSKHLQHISCMYW